MYGCAKMLLLIAILSINMILLGGGYHVHRQIREAKKEVRTFLEVEANGSPRYVNLYGQFVEDISKRAAVSVQKALAGSLGGQMKGINAALEQEAMEVNPGLTLAEFLPKKLKKNPLALMGLQSVYQKMAASLIAGNQAAGGNGKPAAGSDQARFEL